MLALLAMAIVTTAAFAQVTTPKKQTVASSEKLTELRKERIATLKDAADVSFKLAQNARLEFREALEDRMALLNAELDAAENEAERAALRRQTLDSLKAYEDVARSLVESARGTQLNMLRVKARRLDVELQLEQANMQEPR
ncbi:MAG: hypothetical protein JSS02_12810 [Planctomycetes bacterium]|nr:hypothetical protein [Planctomycetota bacterium]